MIKKYLLKVIRLNMLALLSSAIVIFSFHQSQAQVNGLQETKWVRINALHHWFSNGGAEIEYGRRGRTFLGTDQLDGLRYPGEYVNDKGVNVGKALWIGTTNFTDPTNGITYPYKVICAGRANMNLNAGEMYPEELSLIGKFERPNVIVDNALAADIEFDDEVDEFDPSIPSDRMIVNKFNTSIGISCTRKVLAFSQQYHDNYFIYEYVFKNTGIIDEQGTTMTPRTLTDVIFHFQYRYAFAGEGYLGGWAALGNGAAWGRNTQNDAVGQDASHTLPAPNDFRAVFAYYGIDSNAPSISDDIGEPRYTDGSILGGTNFAGVAILHADKSAQDQSDDPNQPTTTQFIGSDNDDQGLGPFNAGLMTAKYGRMTAGHPTQTQAEQIGKDANGWPTGAGNLFGTDNGGYSSAQGFGPYTLAPGDSVRIVVVEAVAGIMKDRRLVETIARNWFNNSAPFVLPNGSTTTDRNIYKNTWVFSGKDSLFQSFRRARDNYNNNYNIPQPPPPPSEFKVESGGNRINLSWSAEAESWPNFNGYLLYRAEGRTDQVYDLLFECDKNNVVNSFDDKTARRGFNYFYYIQTKDDGSTNNIQPGVPLVSSKYYTKTSLAYPGRLTRAPGSKLSDIRIVPNPFNINARDIQFGQSTPDRLAFYNLPPVCTIKIYTETGDLIETIEHTSSSGDELWHSLTSSRQLVVSGLYIAYFEVSQDAYEEGTGKLIFKKGESITKKFIVIR